jgi:hypothetical protein
MPTELLNYLILKRNAFGVIFLELVFGGVGICEHLERVRIADAFACVDVDLLVPLRLALPPSAFLCDQ